MVVLFPSAGEAPLASYWIFFGMSSERYFRKVTFGKVTFGFWFLAGLHSSKLLLS